MPLTTNHRNAINTKYGMKQNFPAQSSPEWDPPLVLSSTSMVQAKAKLATFTNVAITVEHSFDFRPRLTTLPVDQIEGPISILSRLSHKSLREIKKARELHRIMNILSLEVASPPPLPSHSTPQAIVRLWICTCFQWYSNNSSNCSARPNSRKDGLFSTLFSPHWVSQ